MLELPDELPVPLLPGALLPEGPGLEGGGVLVVEEPSDPPVALLPPGAVEPGLPLVRGLLP